MSDDAFNELSDDQVERLAILAEECGEVIQIVGKILRHGYDSTHPDDPDGLNNQEMLEKELGDVKAIVGMMCENLDVEKRRIGYCSAAKMKKITQYLHHQ